MDEKKDNLFENEKLNEVTSEPDIQNKDEDINIYESKYTVDSHGWYSDDFENTVKNCVPKNRALSVYKPKEKKFKNFMKNPVVAAVISSLCTCAIALGAFAFAFTPKPVNQGSAIPQTGSTQDNVTKQMSVQDSSAISGIPEVYDKASPSVVSILCKSSSNSYMGTSETMSSGSGIIFRNDGYIMTNNHVIEGAAQVSVTTIAGQTFDAKVVGGDAKTDIAVLKVESDKELVAAELGDSSSLRVGDLALAIGNPLREELAGTLTVGYISAINRSMVINGKQMTMIQTDAAINPGNSGGALLNIKGQVIGINTAKSTGYDVEGLGFAIPINETKPIIEAIIKNGYVTGRPIIGLSGRTVTEAIAKANNLPVGVYVVEVVEYGAAEKAGIKVGDVIVSCEGKEIKTIDEINSIKDQHKVGDTISFTIVRNGSKKDINIELQEEKPTKDVATAAPQQGQGYQDPSNFFSWFGW